MAERLVIHGKAAVAVTCPTDNLARVLAGRLAQAGRRGPGLVITDLLVGVIAGQLEKLEVTGHVRIVLGNQLA